MVWEVLSEQRLFGKLLISLYFGLCGKKEMLALRKTRKWKRCRGIYFTSISPYEPLVPSHLETFHSMLFNSVGFWFLVQKGWITLRGVESGLEEICVCLCVYFSFYIGGV